MILLISLDFRNALKWNEAVSMDTQRVVVIENSQEYRK